MDLIKNVNGKLLRCGYTTGSCATAAAKAAAQMILTQKPADIISISTPKGIDLTIDILNTCIAEDYAHCAVRKDSGDDPDITNGELIYARVEKTCQGINIDGGYGVGTVTKAGLDQSIGSAAINNVPRKMISRELLRVAEKYGYKGGFSVIIEVPNGEELAKRTFNPKMGIEGGISIIGTTGIVEPMSNQAISDTIRIELSQLKLSGISDVLLTPGNYGKTFVIENLNLSHEGHVKCSNLIGSAIDSAVELEFKHILLVGHIGKLIKLGIGITNTHSNFGDGRMETLLACALEAGADISILKNISTCIAADAALEVISKAGLLNKTMKILGKRIDACLKKRVPESVNIGYICFTNSPEFEGILFKSENADELSKIWELKK